MLLRYSVGDGLETAIRFIFRSITGRLPWNVKSCHYDFEETDGTDINATDMHGNTPLFCAVASGFIPLVEFLLKHGADPDIPNKHGNTALRQAVYEGDIELCTTLINAGAAVNIRPLTDQQYLFGFGESLLSYTLLIRHNCTLAELLLKAGTIPHKFLHGYDNTVFDYECYGSVKFIQLLLSAGFLKDHEAWLDLVLKVKDASPRQLEVCNFLLARHVKPMSLQYQSRLAIRSVLANKRSGSHFRQNIYKLPLPSLLKDYVALEYI